MRELMEYIYSDLYRYDGKTGFKNLIKIYFKQSMFRITVWYRIAHHFNKKRWIFKSLTRWILSRKCARHCMLIPHQAKIGYGMMIYHGYMLLMHHDTIIGDNVTLTHNISLATEKGGVPVIGDRVRFGIGVVVVGGVKIGNDVVIGSNCTVTKDIPDNNVAVGYSNQNLDRKFNDFVDRYYWSPEITKK